ANLRTNVLTANVITATHLNVDGAMIDKLMTNNLLANELVANSVMTGSMQTNALNAITANITTVRSQVLQANVVEATHIKSDTALIDKLFATTANIDRLTSKTAFINDIKAIDISADRITTGTLNASNVNIINLNVNDLAGNRSEFVRSAWNTALGESTYIEGNEIRSIGAGGEEISIGSGALNFYNSAGQHLVWMEPTYSDKYAGEVGFGINLRHNRQFSIIRRKTTVPDEVIMQINPLDEHVTFLNDVTVGRLRIKGTNQWLLSRPEGGASLIDSHAVRLGIGRDTGWTDVFTINENHNVDSFGRLRMNDNNIADVSDLEVNSHVYIRKSRGSSYYARMQYRDINEFHLFADGGLLFGQIYAGQWERILQLLHGGVNMYRRLNMQGNSIINQSDRRLKQNIHDTTISALERIRGTRFVDYEWIDSKRPQGTHLGVIAQETPWLVAYDPDAEFLSIDSSKQTMYNSLAIQELDSNVIQLSNRVEEVDTYTQQALSETQQLKEKVEELEKEINKLKGAS
ncbi:tail fiber domain-containing protein, partial [Atopococcus tabaci]|uniref:tail fiber domain-containing protein n=1 Tax=Atopococcus tabaci TaxID=269774 RepID=UPI002409C8C0